jgi:DNA-binding phage protein
MANSGKATQKIKTKRNSAKAVTSSHSKQMSELLLNCIRDEDLDSFQNILISFLATLNKSHFAKKAGIGRATLYEMIDPKRNFNPELSTVAAVIRALANEGANPHVT